MSEPTEMELMVAKAIANDMLLGRIWSDLDQREVEDFLGHARAAIEAMREPTKEMIEPGNDAVRDATSLDGYESGGYYCTIEPTCARDTWQAMIDVASPPSSEGK